MALWRILWFAANEERSLGGAVGRHACKEFFRHHRVHPMSLGSLPTPVLLYSWICGMAVYEIDGKHAIM